MKNRKIVLLIIVILALLSFYNIQKKFYVLVKTKIQSYQMDRKYPGLTEQKAKRKRYSYPVTFEKNDNKAQLIYFKLE